MKQEDFDKLKKGDKVKIVKNNGKGYFDRFIGKTATIIGKWSDDAELDVPLEDGRPYSLWHKEEIES